MRTHLILACLIVAPGLRAQLTHTVSGGGTALQQTIVAAAPGDTLLVQSGTYSGIDIDKGLTILCDPGVLIAASGVALNIHDVPGPQALVLRNAQIVSSGSSESLRVQNCVGHVLLDQLDDLTGLPLGGASVVGNTGMVLLKGLAAAHIWYRLTISGSQHVELSHSPNLPSVWATGAAVHISNCVILPRQNNMAAVSMTASKVSVNNSSLSGGPLTLSFWWSTPGVALVSGELMITGSSSILGGTNAVNAPAIESTNGLVRISPTSQLVAIGAPLMTGGATLVTEPLPAVAASGALSGTLFSGQVEAEPGSYTAVHFNLPAPLIALPFGDVWIPLGSLAIDSGFVPVAGVRTFGLLLPPLPVALPILLQPVSLTVAGQILIGPPTPVLIN